MERNKLPFGFSWWLLAFTQNLLTTTQDVYALPFNNMHVYANNQILPQATLHGCVSSSYWHS
jgi:hypothetical protein